MKLRYYLRGMGLGILVTAFLMRISFGDGKEQLSNDEIRARALRLGMMDSVSLAEMQKGEAEESKTAEEIDTAKEGKTPEETKNAENAENENVVEPEDSAEPENSTESEDSAKPENSTEPEDSMKPEDSTGPKDATKPENAAKPENATKPENSADPSDTAGLTGEAVLPTGETGKTVSITIKRGDSSLAVSNALVNAGLIEDAREYDRYLCAGGYDKSINTGTFTIPVDAGQEEIAEIITGKK